MSASGLCSLHLAILWCSQMFAGSSASMSGATSHDAATGTECPPLRRPVVPCGIQRTSMLFRTMLKKAADQLTPEDVDALTYIHSLCKSGSERPAALEVFRLLEVRGVFSADRLEPLEEILEGINRHDVANTVVKDFKVEMKGRYHSFTHNASACTHTHTHTYTHTHTHTHTHAHTNTHSHKHTLAHTHKQILAHTHSHSHTHTCTHTYMKQVCVVLTQIPCHGLIPGNLTSLWTHQMPSSHLTVSRYLPTYLPLCGLIQMTYCWIISCPQCIPMPHCVSVSLQRSLPASSLTKEQKKALLRSLVTDPDLQPEVRSLVQDEGHRHIAGDPLQSLSPQDEGHRQIAGDPQQSLSPQDEGHRQIASDPLQSLSPQDEGHRQIAGDPQQSLSPQDEGHRQIANDPLQSLSPTSSVSSSGRGTMGHTESRASALSMRSSSFSSQEASLTCLPENSSEIGKETAPPSFQTQTSEEGI